MSGASTVPGAVPAGYVLIGPISPSGDQISQFRRLVASDLPDATSQNSSSFTISYDASGNISMITYENGNVLNNTYDNLGNLTTITTTNTIQNSTETQILSYSSLGNLTSIEISYQ